MVFQYGKKIWMSDFNFQFDYQLSIAIHSKMWLECNKSLNSIPLVLWHVQSEMQLFNNYLIIVKSVIEIANCQEKIQFCETAKMTRVLDMYFFQFSSK